MSWNQWDTARREAFAREVFKRVAELHRRAYEDRWERFARLNDPTDPGVRGMFDQQMFDHIIAAREAGRFSYWARGGPGPFMLMPGNEPFEEAVHFFEYWKRTNPAATPTEESRQRCLAEADTLVPPEDSFSKDEFMMRVSENFDYWKQEA
jgi:hypothetical protein